MDSYGKSAKQKLNSYSQSAKQTLKNTKKSFSQKKNKNTELDNLLKEHEQQENDLISDLLAKPTNYSYNRVRPQRGLNNQLIPDNP